MSCESRTLGIKLKERDMTKDKKELEALSGLCEENNVIMVRSFLPQEIRKKRRHLKSGIQQYKGSIHILKQIKNSIEFYKSRSKDKIGWDALRKRIENWIEQSEQKKKEFSKMLDDEFQSKKHKLNEPENSLVKENALGKLISKTVKPIPINKQTMNIVDYKKGDIFIK